MACFVRSDFVLGAKCFVLSLLKNFETFPSVTGFIPMCWDSVLDLGGWPRTTGWLYEPRLGAISCASMRSITRRATLAGYVYGTWLLAKCGPVLCTVPSNPDPMGQGSPHFVLRCTCTKLLATWPQRANARSCHVPCHRPEAGSFGDKHGPRASVHVCRIAPPCTAARWTRASTVLIIQQHTLLYAKHGDGLPPTKLNASLVVIQTKSE